MKASKSEIVIINAKGNIVCSFSSVQQADDYLAARPLLNTCKIYEQVTTYQEINRAYAQQSVA